MSSKSKNSERCSTFDQLPEVVKLSSVIEFAPALYYLYERHDSFYATQAVYIKKFFYLLTLVSIVKLYVSFKENDCDYDSWEVQKNLLRVVILLFCAMKS